jgi:hypothetical protein
MTAKTSAIARGVGVIGATLAIMVGATFAALSSSVTLADNQVGVGTASLQIAGQDGNFTTAIAGFKALNLVPDTPSAPFYFYLRNNGAVPLQLAVQSSLTSGQLGGLDPEHIKGTLAMSTDGGATYPAATTVEFTLADLVNNATPYTDPAAQIAPGATQLYRIVWEADDEAGTGSGGQLTSNFNLTITGTNGAED